MEKHTLTAREKRLIEKMKLPPGVKANVEKVWGAQEYGFQREYANMLILLIIPFLVIFAVISENPDYLGLTHFYAGTAWVLYFLIPVFIIVKISSKILKSQEPADLLGHTAMLLWLTKKRSTTIAKVALSAALIAYFFFIDFNIVAISFAVSLAVMLICIFIVGNKVSRFLDNLEKSR